MADIGMGAAILLAMLSAQVVLMTAHCARKVDVRSFWDIAGACCFCLNSIAIIALIWRTP